MLCGIMLKPLDISLISWINSERDEGKDCRGAVVLSASLINRWPSGPYIGNSLVGDCDRFERLLLRDMEASLREAKLEALLLKPRSGGLSSGCLLVLMVSARGVCSLSRCVSSP